MKSPKILLLLVIVVFLATRLYKIAEIPPSVYWDEASIGYNAYSISQTGKDEWGRFLPLDFEAFGEYKLPLYIYSTVPFIKLFGLNEFSVRIPAVFFSLGVVIFSFLLARKLSKNDITGLLTAFFVTISQWFFIISRTGFEAAAGLFFFILGIYFFISALEGKKIFMIASAVCLLLSLYSYNSFRIATPITLLILIIFYFKLLKEFVRRNLILISFCLVILAVGGFGVINSVLSGRATRLDEVGISTVYNQRKYQTLAKFLSGYFSHFNPGFLFFTGDGNGRIQQPESGQINLIYLPFLLLGIIYIFQKRKKEYLLPLTLLLISPIPASITRESPHALRSISAVPFIAIITSFGVLKLASFFNKKLYIYLFVVLVSTLSFLIYFKDFLLNYPKETANQWQYAYKRINKDYIDEFINFDHIVISDRDNQPYIFTLFYQNIDPNQFRSKVQYNTSERRVTSLVKGFDKFIYTNVDYYQLPYGKSLIFTHPTDRMDEIEAREVISNPDGSVAVYVYEYEK